MQASHFVPSSTCNSTACGNYLHVCSFFAIFAIMTDRVQVSGVSMRVRQSLNIQENEVEMSELLSQLWTPELQAAFTVVVVLLVILYVLSIIWVVRDAYLRGSYWYVWAIVALIPLLGIIAYCLLRPPLLQIDRDEQELEIALKQRELMKYGECANCGYPVESDFVLCPNCHQRLKNLCGTCNHALDPTWTVCPYCATPVAGGPRTRRAPQQQRAARTQQPQQAASQQQTRQARPAQSEHGAQ